MPLRELKKGDSVGIQVCCSGLTLNPKPQILNPQTLNPKLKSLGSFRLLFCVDILMVASSPATAIGVVFEASFRTCFEELARQEWMEALDWGLGFRVQGVGLKV